MNTTEWSESGGHPTDILPEYVRCRAAGRGRIERHLATCVECRDEVEVLRALAGPVLDELTAAERELAFAEVQRRRALARSPVTKLWRVAAAIALLLGSVGVWQVVRTSATGTEWSPSAVVQGWEDDLSELDPQLDEVMLALGYPSEGTTEVWTALDDVDPAELVGPWEEGQ